MATVDIREVRKAFGPVEILHGVSVDIPDGAFAVSYTHLTLPTILRV